MNITLDDVGFWLIGHFGPIADFTNIFEQKDAFSLTSTDLNLKINLQVS